jgi:hypothetical protein
MKKSKFFMAAGTIALALTAVFATKANKRFSTIKSAYTGSYYIRFEGTADYLTANVSNDGGQLAMKICTHGGTVSGTAEGSLITINHNALTDKVYFK